MRTTIFTLLAGLALGTFSHVTSSLPGGWRWTGNFGALWVATAFFMGSRTRHWKMGASSGAATLAIASVAHYVPWRIAREGISSNVFRWPVFLWIFVGIGVGALFGGVAAIRRGRRFSILGAAMVAATFAGEAFVLWRTGHPRASQVAVPIEVTIAVLLPVLLIASWKQRAITLLVAAALVPVVVLALSAFMGVIHRVYPGI